MVGCLAVWRRLAVSMALLLMVAAPLAADTACLLDEERSAVVERARLVFQAQHTIDVSAFIVGKEPFSLASMALLREAARRGVRVRLLVDAQWNKLPKAVEAELLANGVEIRHYHPFRLCHLRWVTRRMHDKLLVVDRASLIAGGRNIESPYFGLGRQVERRNYLDADVLVAGGIVDKAAAYFERLWTSRGVRESRASARPAAVARAANILDQHLAWLHDRVDDIRGTPEAVRPTCQDVGPMRFVFDPPGKKGLAPGVAEALLGLLDGAQESVVIESPYLVPTRGFRRGLLRALERGVQVRILTNSLASTDNLWTQAGYVGERRWLVRHGVELWEYLGPESLHAKTAVMDRTVAVVGSFNLDPRSQRLNTELAVVVDDPGWAGDLVTSMDGHLAQAVRIDRDGRPIGYDTRYPNVGCGKIWKLRFMRLLAPLVRGQL